MLGWHSNLSLGNKLLMVLSNIYSPKVATKLESLRERESLNSSWFPSPIIDWHAIWPAAMEWRAWNRETRTQFANKRGARALVSVETDSSRAHDENSPSSYPCAPIGHSLLTSVLTQPRNPPLDSKILLAWRFKTGQRHDSPEENTEGCECVCCHD